MISAPELNDIRERLHLGRYRRALHDRPLFTTAILDRRYRPLRGLVWSVVVHFSLAAVLASIPVSLSVAENQNLKDQAVIVDVDEFEDALFLPILGVSDSPSASFPPDEPQRPPQKQSASVPEKKGLIYPGPQPIFSEFANPTNQIQTILQPSLINPPRLQAPLVLPNVVRLAEPSRLAPPAVEPRFRMPDTAAQPVRPPLSPAAAPLGVALSGPARPLAAPVIEPRFRLPDITAIINPALTTVPITPANLSLAAPDSPQLAPPAAPAAPDPVSRTGDAKEDLLVLSPTPARRDQPVVVPPGEARGQFSISPESNLSFPGTDPGSRGTVAAVNSTPEPSVNVTPDREPPQPKNSSAPAATNSSGASRGIDPFEGITILGGIETPGTPRASRPNSNPEPLQTSYGITILAAGGSGGGLPDFGVFGKEQVHTVYLDMRRTMFDNPISWTAEYAVGQGTTAAVVMEQGILALQEDVVLPFPIDKHRPLWVSDLPRQYAGRMVIAYAVINSDGKIEQLSIKESPDPLLNEPVLDALRKWTFRPARRDGQVVPAKMLLGIPLF